jgi:molecular chaperone DnaK
MDASMKLGEAIYKSQQASAEGGNDDGDQPRNVDDDIVDADFEDLGEDKKRG